MFCYFLGSRYLGKEGIWCFEFQMPSFKPQKGGLLGLVNLSPEYLVCKSQHVRTSVLVQQTYENRNHKLCERDYNIYITIQFHFKTNILDDYASPMPC